MSITAGLSMCVSGTFMRVVRNTQLSVLLNWFGCESTLYIAYAYSIYAHIQNVNSVWEHSIRTKTLTRTAQYIKWMCVCVVCFFLFFCRFVCVFTVHPLFISIALRFTCAYLRTVLYHISAWNEFHLNDMNRTKKKA